MKKNFEKWVAAFGNATSISDRGIATYAKNITLRYPFFMPFDGNKIRFHLSNITGSEPVKIDKAFVRTKGGTFVPITKDSSESFSIASGEETVTDEIPFDVYKGSTLEISLYLKDFTAITAGTFVSGPLSKGLFAYGDFSDKEFLPNSSRSTNWYYFFNTVDVFTESKNHALICYGDSITAQSWPDFLIKRAYNEGFHNVSIIRRAISGTRILREYDCITYAAYGLKGSKRFPVEMNVCGAKAVIIQHGINDIIHPVGIENNPFRPMSDMPTAKDLIDGFKNIYLLHAKKQGLKIYGATLLPILG